MLKRRSTHTAVGSESAQTACLQSAWHSPVDARDSNRAFRSCRQTRRHPFLDHHLWPPRVLSCPRFQISQLNAALFARPCRQDKVTEVNTAGTSYSPPWSQCSGCVAQRHEKLWRSADEEAASCKRKQYW